MKIFITCAISFLLLNYSYSQVWEAQYGLTIEQLQKYSDSLTNEGFVPCELDAIKYNDKVLFSEIWRKEKTSAWESRVNLSKQELEQLQDKLTPLGYAPSNITVYKDLYDIIRFGVIWKMSPYTEFICKYDLSETEFDNYNKILSMVDYMPYTISVYEEGANLKFAAAWKKMDNVSFYTEFNLNEIEYQAAYDALTPKGYYPIEIASYNKDGQVNFAAVWLNQSGKWWESRSGLTEVAFQSKFEDLEQNGFSPYIFSTYMNNGILNYAGAWQYEGKQNLVNISVEENYNPHFDYENYESILAIPPVEQETQVWCWLACGEMIFEHYNIPSQNKGSYQCGIIRTISSPSSPCYSDCFKCVIPAGSNVGTLNMIANYAMSVSEKQFSYSNSKIVSFEHIIQNIDNNIPVLCGTSYNSRNFFYDSEHVVLLIGYRIKNGKEYVIINDPFPYPKGQNPYFNHGASGLNINQYEISYESFINDIFWNWTISNISFN